MATPPGRRPATGTPNLEWKEDIAGSKLGDRSIRIGTHRNFIRTPTGHFVPRPSIDQPVTPLGRALQRAGHLLWGNPLMNSQEMEERLGKAKALAVLSSDALSSVAYATEEIMKVVVLGGLAALNLTLPVSMAIVLLLAIVVTSYRQTIKAYPSGGGSYIVASDNLGQLPGLTAGVALLIDYVLTVAVSVAAGVAAITSWAPDLHPYTVPLSVAAVVMVAWANLRGMREAGTLFAIPTYGFILIMYALLGFGLLRLLTGGVTYVPPETALVPGHESVTLFLLLSAFAQGCTAMTGTEAISNGVPVFKAPESPNARATIVWMGLLLGSMFLGLSFLATHFNIVPAGQETVLSQIGRTVFGEGPLWTLLQFATMAILILAANTSFAGFPRLASILARDGFLPRAFRFRGDRLAFNTGIIALGALSIVLLVIFSGSVDKLIPLYAVGVFLSFTLSQAGMVVHWRRGGGPGWRRAALVNGLGAVATGVVTLVIAGTKFIHGAWLIVLLIPATIGLLRGVHHHYQRLTGAQVPETPITVEGVRIRTIVPVADLGIESQQALAYARRAAGDDGRVTAVHVSDDAATAQAFQDRWQSFDPGVSLVIIESPFRSLVGPLLAYIEALKESHPDDTLTVVLPEFVVSHWWENLLHNQTAFRLKIALLVHPGIVVTSVPYHLSKAGPPGS